MLRFLQLAAYAAFLLLAGVSAAAPGADDVILERDVVYGKGGDVELQLDLARPKEGDGPFPAIVFVHGGGWRGGNRVAYLNEIQNAARRGYVAVTVTYRLTQPDEKNKPKVPFPAQLHDAKCAVRWLRANAMTYRVDPDRIGATGGSAGGHLSLLLGLTDDESGLEGSGGNDGVSSRVQAVVNYFGPTDMRLLCETSPGAVPYVEALLDGTPDAVPEQYKAASPVTYASADDPPVLTLHGSIDKLVPPSQAETLDAKLKDVGATHTLMILDGQAHGFGGEAAVKAQTAMYEFFDKHLKSRE